MDPTTTHEHQRLVRSLFPELVESLDEAYERNRMASGEKAAGQGDFDVWLDEEAERLRSGELGRAPFAGLGEQDAVAFELAFTAARRTAKRLNLTLPEPETFAAAGVDFTRLGERLREDPTLRPIPAPFGLGADAWQAAFRHQAQAGQSHFTVSPDHPDALVIATEARAEFRQLDQAAPGLVTVHSDAHSETPSVTWTIRLIPAEDKPPVLGFGFTHGPHVSLPEMLMLQLMRSADGLSPVDTSSFTWLAGALSEGRLAARHVFDEREGVIRVNCREIGNQGPHLGARPPIA